MVKARWIVALTLVIGCKKTPVAASDAGSIGGGPIDDGGAAFPSGHALMKWTIPRDPTAIDAELIAVDVPHTRAIVEMRVGGSSPHTTEIVGIDWSTHAMMRVSLERLAGTGPFDSTNAAAIAAVAGYGRVLASIEHARDANMLVTSSGLFFRFGGALYRANADGTNATAFGAREARNATLSPSGNLVAYVGCDDTCRDRTLRIADIAGSVPERRVTAPANPNAPFFSPDGSRIYFTASAGDKIPSCLFAVDTSTAQSTKLACATIVQPAFVMLAPSGKRVALFASGGPSGIGDPELTLVSLPDGAMVSRRTLHWSMEFYSALTDDGDLLGTTYTSQWGWPGNTIVKLHARTADGGATGVSANEGTTVSTFAFAPPDTVIALARSSVDRESTTYELDDITPF